MTSSKAEKEPSPKPKRKHERNGDYEMPTADEFAPVQFEGDEIDWLLHDGVGRKRPSNRED